MNATAIRQADATDAAVIRGIAAAAGLKVRVARKRHAIRFCGAADQVLKLVAVLDMVHANGRPLGNSSDAFDAENGGLFAYFRAA